MLLWFTLFPDLLLVADDYLKDLARFPSTKNFLLLMTFKNKRYFKYAPAPRFCVGQQVLSRSALAVRPRAPSRLRLTRSVERVHSHKQSSDPLRPSWSRHVNSRAGLASQPMASQMHGSVWGNWPILANQRSTLHTTPVWFLISNNSFIQQNQGYESFSRARSSQIAGKQIAYWSMYPS